MERKVGTISRGIRCPIIREGDNLAEIVVDSVLDAAESEGFEIRDKDVISVTESVVASFMKKLCGKALWKSSVEKQSTGLFLFCYILSGIAFRCRNDKMEQTISCSERVKKAQLDKKEQMFLPPPILFRLSML